MKYFENPRMRVLDFRLNIIGTYQSRRAELQHTFNRAVCLEMFLRYREKRFRKLWQSRLLWGLRKSQNQDWSYVVHCGEIYKSFRG